MNAQTVFALALAAAALGCAVFAAYALALLAGLKRGARTLDQALGQRATSMAAAACAGQAKEKTVPSARSEPEQGSKNRFVILIDWLSVAALKWLDTPLGAKMVAAEDRRLLERCGFVDARTRARFLAARIAGSVVLPLFALAWMNGEAPGARFAVTLFAAFSAGFMAPKWVIARKARGRQRAVNNELPVFVDLLRLLQGVGLSLDQSLQVMINDFSSVLPELAMELAIAHRQFSTGRTREQSLHRLSTSFESDDLNAVMRLVIQLDKHGGAVQEPLRQFGDRLRESRRAMLREKVGALTVKMTGVMVVTLLPALLIMTAGPGFLAVIHTLSVTK